LAVDVQPSLLGPELVLGRDPKEGKLPVDEEHSRIFLMITITCILHEYLPRFGFQTDFAVANV
jgi:hypothetical protein